MDKTNIEMLKLKKQVLDSAKKAYNEKLMAGTSGNLSIWHEESGSLIITPSSYDYNIMDIDDIVVIDIEGNMKEGIHKPSSEWKLHAEIYKNLPHIKAVVHTHSPYATSFAVLNKEIPVILIEMIPFLKGSIEVAAYAAQGSAMVGTNALPILKNKNACLLANHGVVTVGESLDKAYINSIYTEDAAKIYHMALSVGEPVVIKDY